MKTEEYGIWHSYSSQKRGMHKAKKLNISRIPTIGSLPGLCQLVLALFSFND